MDDTEVGQIGSWVGLDVVGKQYHHATVVSAAGEPLLELAVRNDDAVIERLLDRALESGPCALVIDQPLDWVAGGLRRAPAPGGGRLRAGLVMRRASELYPGEAKTDRRDSFVLADTARTHARRLHRLEADDETLERLRVLGGYDDDLAHDVNRTANRLRDMLLAVSPALERVLGPRLDHPAARALLVRYPTPTALRAAGRRRLGPLAKRHAPRMGARPVDEVQAALGAQTVTVPAEETAGRVIRDLAEELDRLAARRDRFATEIEQIFTSHLRAPVLMSIPGIGARTGAPAERAPARPGRRATPTQYGRRSYRAGSVRRMVRLSGPTPNRALAKSQPHHQASQSPGDQLLREAALKPSGDARLRQPRINDRASEPAATASSRGAAAQPIDRQAATDRG